jgi:hypothetical protein
MKQFGLADGYNYFWGAPTRLQGVIIPNTTVYK